MWEEIIAYVSSALYDAIYTEFHSRVRDSKLITPLHSKMETKAINQQINREMRKISNSTINCIDFVSLLKTRWLVKTLKGFYSLLQYNSQDIMQVYIESVIEFLVIRCKCNNTDAKKFVCILFDCYKSMLEIADRDYQGNHRLFQYITTPFSDTLSRLFEVEEKNMYRNRLASFFSSLVGREERIDDSSIISYHDLLKRKVNTIAFSGIVGAESKRLQNIRDGYVENVFSLYIPSDELDDYSKRLIKAVDFDLKTLFDLSNKVVLIGPAGSGKTTTLNYLFCFYEELYHSYPFKLKINLKDYAKQIGEKKDLLWCLSSEFLSVIESADYNLRDIRNMISSYLKEGKCFVILDALDEVPSLTLRDTVREEIENFCRVYYLNRIIISTREVGYLKSHFDESFLHFRVNEFNEKQIEQYSKNWYQFYNVNGDYKKFWASFKSEVHRANCLDLISNPIILVLALIIFDYNNSLPSRRVEFYESCIKTFLSEREIKRYGKDLKELLGKKARRVLETGMILPKLAYYKSQHIAQSEDNKFSQSDLRGALLKAVMESDNCNGQIYWADAVDEFLTYLVERTELIQEKKNDDYDFAHRTFNEYFLAVYYSTELEDTEICRKLKEWIGDSNNDGLAGLIIEMIVRRAQTKQLYILMNMLFDGVINENVDSGRYLEILSDLYSHNLMSPVYCEQYHELLLLNPELVYRVYRPENKKALKYDEDELADMFCRKASDDGNLYRVIDSLDYYTANYCYLVSEKNKEENIQYIAKLFAFRKQNYGGQHWFLKDKMPLNKHKELLSFFMGEGIMYTLIYPQVFLSSVSIALDKDEIIDFEKLYEFKFATNNMACRYITTYAIQELLNRAFNNPREMLLLLIILRFCCVKTEISQLGIQRETETAGFVDFIFGDNKKDEGYELLKMLLKEKSLYMNDKEDIYKKLFDWEEVDYMRVDSHFHREDSDLYDFFFSNSEEKRKFSPIISKFLKG